MPIADAASVDEVGAYLLKVELRAGELDKSLTAEDKEIAGRAERIRALRVKSLGRMRLFDEDMAEMKTSVDDMKKQILFLISQLKQAAKAEDFSRFERMIDQLHFEEMATRKDVHKLDACVQRT